MTLKKIGIDVENGDEVNGESVTKRMVPAVLGISKERPDVEISIHGHEKRIKDAFGKNLPSQITVVPASEFYSQSDELSRPRRGSVLYNLADSVHKGEIDGFFSIGDTSKIAKEGLRMRVKGAKPSLVGIFPNIKGGEFVLSDIGFTNQTSKKRLYSDVINEWAGTVYSQGIMASVYMQSRGVEKPKWGILSIGTEEHKGSDVDKRLEEMIHQGIKEKGLDRFVEYVGKVEPKDCFDGKIDIALEQGYIANKLLKMAEGSLGVIKHWAKGEISRLDAIDKLRLASGKGVLEKMKNNILDKANPDKYSGALILGFEGVAVKGHGASSRDAIYYGIHNLANCTNENSGKKLMEIVHQYTPSK